MRGWTTVLVQKLKCGNVATCTLENIVIELNL